MRPLLLSLDANESQSLQLDIQNQSDIISSKSSLDTIELQLDIQNQSDIIFA